MADYIIYTDEVVNMRVSCIEADAQAMATSNGASFVLDTFDAYDLNQLEVVGGVIQVKSQDTQDAEATTKLMDELRSHRDLLLKSSDWTQVPDAPVDQATWATYRQQLRDLPNNTEDPANPTWPTKPE
jgi:hypothetical protein